MICFVPLKVPNWEGLEAHPAADAYPMLGEVDSAEVREAILKSGYHPDKPIVLYDGKVADGRNRQKICRELKAAGLLNGHGPHFVEWQSDGADSLTDWVVETNSKRRHLDASQKAAVAVGLLPVYEAEARERMLAGVKVESANPSQNFDQGATKGKATAQAAQATGANRQYVADAKKIKAQDETLFDLVKQGALGITDAKEIVKLAAASPELAESVKKKIGTLQESADPERSRKAVHTTIQDAIHEQKRRERPNFNDAGALPEGTWNLVYVDPPWKYDSVATPDKRAVENQYPTMDLQDIKNLPVAEIAAEDSVLFLWTTVPKLKEGIEVVEAWGFRYTTAWAWKKLGAPGMGYWGRNNWEILLIGVKGNPGAPDEKDRPMETVFEFPKGRHSEKPEDFYTLIEQVKPNFKKIELFARGPARPGWDAWGNQAPEANIP